MNLFINSPAYYTQQYGVIDSVYKMCNVISRNVDVSRYTSLIDTIGIVPIIAPAHIINQGLCKEVKRVSLPYRMAHISLRMDFDFFFSAGEKEKEALILKNIFESLDIVKKKLGKEFKVDEMKNDIHSVLSDLNLLESVI